MHFDGSVWSVVPTPQPSPWGAHSLRGVFARDGEVVAVGAWENATQGLDTFVIRLDQDAGAGFEIVPSTNVPGNGQGWNELYDIALVGDHLWAVGFGQSQFSGQHETLVERSPFGSFATPFCFGGGSVAACPCGNTGAAGRGCENSAGTGGARLDPSGSTDADSVVLTAAGLLPTSLSIFLQGDATSAGAPFGDGVRCVGGNLKRLYVKGASSGSVSAPAPGDPSIMAQSAALGDPIAPGTLRFYQVYYRDPSLAFCPAPAGDAFNVSNGLQVAW
jgi:hypothetical protein